MEGERKPGRRETPPPSGERERRPRVLGLSRGIARRGWAGRVPEPVRLPWGGVGPAGGAGEGRCDGARGESPRLFGGRGLPCCQSWDGGGRGASERDGCADRGSSRLHWKSRRSRQCAPAAPLSPRAPRFPRCRFRLAVATRLRKLVSLRSSAREGVGKGRETYGRPASLRPVGIIRGPGSFAGRHTALAGPRSRGGKRPSGRGRSRRGG